MTRIFIYDTTLRDGSQGEGVNFSLQDKLRLTQRLDELGIDFIEGGYPLSNPKDFEYFQQVRHLPLRHARVAAFGMTRRKNTSPAEDTCLKALLDAQTPLVTIVGKTWDLHVSEVLGTTLEENLRMIGDSVAYCKQAGREVFYDAEHYFDGFKRNPEYALQTLRAAEQAGASFLILCDTNGGTLPDELAGIVEHTRRQVRGELGIHCHNDCDVAVANSLAAVARGVTQVQGTINGIGERCGNADLVSIIANLVLKRGCEVIGHKPGAPATGAADPGVALRACVRPVPALRFGLVETDGGLALRLRDGQHELPQQPAVCRHQRLRPQGRHAHPRRGPAEPAPTNTSTRPRWATSGVSWSASCRARARS